VIVLRRLLTVPPAILLTLVLTVTLFAHRANESVLSPDFYREQLATIGLSDAVHDEILPTAVDDFLTAQEEKLPENFQDIGLPTDPASQQIVLDLARTAAPPEYIEAVTNDAIEALLAYLKGERDDLDWSVSFGQPVQSVFATAGSDPSAFEVAWTDLALTDHVLQSLSAALEVPELNALQDEQARQALTLLRGDGVDSDAAVDLSTRLFENAPPGSEIPALAEQAMAGTATPQQLADLEAAIVEAGVEPVEAQNFVALLAGTGTPPPGSFALTILLGDERDAAVEWFDTQLFAASTELAAYLTGEQDTLNVVIDFSEFPELASVAAVPLKSDPDDLLRNGYQLNEAALQQQLDDAEAPPFASLQEMRQIFLPAGRTFGIADLQGIPASTGGVEGNPASTGGVEGNPAGSDGLQGNPAGTDGLTIDQVSSIAGPAIRWGVPVGATIVLVLAAIIGVLGGRAWWSRIVWTALPIAGAAAIVAVAAGPVFAITAAPALETAVADSRVELIARDAPYTPLGLRALDQLETTVNAQAGALATNAVVVAALAILVIAAATVWHLYAARRPDEHTEQIEATEATTPEPFPLLTDDVTEEQAKAA